MVLVQEEVFVLLMTGEFILKVTVLLTDRVLLWTWQKKRIILLCRSNRDQA